VPTPADSTHVPNIGPRGRRLRLAGGVAAFLAGCLGTALLIARGRWPAWHLGLAPLYYFAALGWYQAREKT